MAAFCTVAKGGEKRTSAAGNPYGLITLMTDSGNTDDQGRDIPAFLKCIAFGDAADAASRLKKGQHAYIEGTLSLGIWQPPNGAARLDLSVKCSKLEPTQIGRNKPSKPRRVDPQAPLEQDDRPPFDDPVDFDASAPSRAE
jgi:single-stranded DNA-binding protein